jgi:hypothetical protein
LEDWAGAAVRHDSDDGESIPQGLKFIHQCFDVVWNPVSGVEQNVQGIGLSDLSVGGCSGLAGGPDRVELLDSFELDVDVIGTVDGFSCPWMLPATV